MRIIRIAKSKGTYCAWCKTLIKGKDVGYDSSYASHGICNQCDKEFKVASTTIIKTANKPFRYIGQCDRLRLDNPLNESNWQIMVDNHTKVTLEEFMSQCNWEELIDEGETNLNTFMDNPEAYVAKSIWSDKECYYLQSRGFEFIFVR